ncbi:MAG: 50S ribosomal protein L17 [Alphaproteobacteria bacterium]
MKHGVSQRRLGRKSSHLKALLNNMATELLRHEQIRTTLPKAKELRKFVEPLITKARNATATSTLAVRRDLARVIKCEDTLKKLMADIAPRFAKTPGGYTRVLKTGFRQGDAAPMAIIALTDGAAKPKKAAPKAAAKPAKAKAAPRAAEVVAEEAPQAE